MIKEIVRAQASTLDLWVEEWTRDALVGRVPEGYDDCVFQMRRLSTSMLRMIGDAPPEVKSPPAPVDVEQAREG